MLVIKGPESHRVEVECLLKSDDPHRSQHCKLHVHPCLSKIVSTSKHTHRSVRHVSLTKCGHRLGLMATNILFSLNSLK